MRGKKTELLGKKFGMLTVIDDNGRVYVTCRCDCGNVKDINKHYLIRGSTKSCGCIKGKHIAKFNGCDEDCFNCIYPDCLMPSNFTTKKGGTLGYG